VAHLQYFSGVGKSFLLITYISNIFPNFYCATSIDTLTTNVEHNGQEVKLSMFDTGGHSDYDRLRPMFYKEADVVILCFSIADPASLENVKSNWYSEVRFYCPLKPVILVGCKLDLRNDQGTIQRLKTKRYTPTTIEEVNFTNNRLPKSD
jgi:Ras-related C3 botulinum toxin substrate 1